jgi:hypothetical protein
MEKTMKTQSIDTSPDAERVLIEMIRKASITKRFAFAQSWTASMFEGARLYEQEQHPQASRQETRLLFAEREYGKNLVDKVRQDLQTYGIQIANSPDYRQAIYPLAEIFEKLDVPYALSGSLASSLHGMQRATLQLDLIADLYQQHTAPLCEQLASQYCFCEEEIKIALEQRVPFIKLIHLKSLLKIVITFPNIPGTGQQLFQRAWHVPLVEGERTIAVLAPEDVILLLLDKFKRSNERADDLWYDLLAVMKVQGTDLNMFLLREQAAIFNTTELLKRAIDDAGLTDTQQFCARCI